MSVSAIAPTPFPYDPDRLQIGVPQPRAEDGQSAAGEDRHLSMFAAGDDSPSFWDVLDVINPLQHIPIVNDIYRDLTGDQIGVGARLAGGTLFGGVVGLAAAAINCVVEESTGKDVGGHVIALFDDDAPAAPASPPATMVAEAPVAPAPSAPVAVAAAPENASSPAKAVAAAEAAPVIALPDSAVAAGGGRPMMFGFDGAQPMPAAPPAPDVTPAAAPVAVTQSGLKPLAQPARYMPIPGRNANVNPANLPQVTVPVSNGSSRSNVPITGRAPNAGVISANMQRALVGQEALAPLPTNSVESAAQTASNPDWFTAAWGQALDKYQRTSQMTGKPATTTITVE